MQISLKISGIQNHTKLAAHTEFSTSHNIQFILFGEHPFYLPLLVLFCTRSHQDRTMGEKGKRTNQVGRGKNRFNKWFEEGKKRSTPPTLTLSANGVTYALSTMFTWLREFVQAFTVR